MVRCCLISANSISGTFEREQIFFKPDGHQLTRRHFGLPHPLAIDMQPRDDRARVLIHREGDHLRPAGRGDQKIFILYHVDNF